MKQITLQYRKIFDNNLTKNWDKSVWNDSFMEYKMKAQFYDSEIAFPLFRDLVHAIPEAEKLHYLVSLSAMGHIQRLDNLFPDVVNTLGSRCIPFQNYVFKILSSDFNNKEKHAVQIDFYSDSILLLDTIGDTLWLANLQEGKEIMETFTVRLQPNLMINSLVL